MRPGRKPGVRISDASIMDVDEFIVVRDQILDDMSANLKAGTYISRLSWAVAFADEDLDRMIARLAPAA